MGPRVSSAVGQRLMHLLVWAALACFVVPAFGQQTQTGVFPSPETPSASQTPATAPQATQPKPDSTPNTNTPQMPAGEAAPPNQNAPEADSTVLQLSPGDLVEVSVYGVPELATKTRITNTGDVYLPLVDYVHVADLNLDEAQTLIEKRLSDGGFVRNPHVTIFVDESASQGATILGEVTRPGVYPVLGERRLYDVISAAGGFTDKAGRVVTITRRIKPEAPVTVHLPSNLSDQTDANVAVAPGDTIVVGRAGIVYVVGDVNRPSGFMADGAPGKAVRYVPSQTSVAGCIDEDFIASFVVEILSPIHSAIRGRRDVKWARAARNPVCCLKIRLTGNKRDDGTWNGGDDVSRRQHGQRVETITHDPMREART